MKRKWIFGILVLAIAAGASAADRARPGDGPPAPDGATRPARVVSDRYEEGTRSLEFRGIPAADGSMLVGLEYRNGSDASVRLVVSTRRFRSQPGNCWENRNADAPHARTYLTNLSASLDQNFGEVLVMRQRNPLCSGLRQLHCSLPRSCIVLRTLEPVPEPRGSADASISPQIGRYVFG